MRSFSSASLEKWYLKNQRDLPWRKNSTPYPIWISEIMLQQTQVENVIPYFSRFLKRFPSIQSLARAKEQSVLAQWSGLGYYSRARNIHKSAKTIVQQHQGRFPKLAEELLQLPGIGPYTAGAIASIAYDIPAAIYDGNVRRVLSRFYLSKSDQKLREISKTLVRQAHSNGIRPSIFNQALMELGALICTPRNPDCEICPLQKKCGAKQKKAQHQFPQRIQAAPTIKKFISTAILSSIKNKSKLLLVQRPQTERWLKNMWEFPMIFFLENSPKNSLSELSKKFEHQLKTPVKLHRPLGAFRHSITNHDLHISVYQGTAGTLPQKARWLNLKALRRISSSSMLTKSLALAGKIL